MLRVPTLWLVFVVNFLALALVWTSVMRCYPNFEAARFWTAAAFAAAAGAAVSLLRGFVETLVPLVIGGTLLVLACCFAAMGIQRFYAAKKQGKNRHAVYDPAPSLAPELEVAAAHSARLQMGRAG
jgi:ABC-type uncharacterized transport system permease subunit